MKIKEGFMLREVASSNIVVPIGTVEVNFSGMMTLNSVGAFIFKQLEKEIDRETVLKAVLMEYDIDEETASKDIDFFIERLSEKGMIEG
ncbi:MAG: PqqD family protein [Oscillospiraceae bacterium]